MPKHDTTSFEAMGWQRLGIAIGIMIIIVVSSNVLVQYPINNWLTWGAVSYPIAFLVADVLNRRFGPKAARCVAYVGFVAALFISAWLASPRFALASGTVFLSAQLCDIYVFDRLRHGRLWQASFVVCIAC